MKKLSLLILLICLFLGRGLAQQMPLYSQYMLNGFLLNPAIAGSEGYSAINLTVREQWIGFKNGPSTYAASFQTRLLRKSSIKRSPSVLQRAKRNSRPGKVSIGGYIFNHNNGAVNRTGLKASYAYHIKLHSSQLSFGLSLMAFQYKLDSDKIKFKNEGDELWAGVDRSVLIPEVDVGVFYTRPEFWIGFSADQLLESILKFGDSGFDQFKLQRHYYVMGGYDLEVNNKLLFTPQGMIKYSEQGNFQADLSTKFIYDQHYWTGLTYRTGNSVIIMAGISIDRLIFGYAFDMGLNSVMKHSFGTHEFTFIAKIGNRAMRYRWLTRY